MARHGNAKELEEVLTPCLVCVPVTSVLFPHVHAMLIGIRSTREPDDHAHSPSGDTICNTCNRNEPEDAGIDQRNRARGQSVETGHNAAKHQ